MCVLIQSYNKLTIATFIVIVELVISLNGSFIYGFIIVIAIGLFMGHVLSCWIVQLFLIYIEPWVAFPLVPHNPHPLLHIYHYF